MRRLRSPLGRRLVVLTVAVSSSLAFVITAVQLMLEYQRDLDDMSAHFAIIGQSYLPSIEETVWLLDQKRLDTLLEGIARLPDFRYADVQHDGRTIAAKGTPEPSSTDTPSATVTHNLPPANSGCTGFAPAARSVDITVAPATW